MQRPQWLKRPQIPSAEGPTTMATETPPSSASDLAELGDRVHDPISGYTGIVIVVAHFLNGCARCGVQSEKLKDDLPQTEQHFDQAQLEVIAKGAFKPATVSVIRTASRRQSDIPPGGPPRENPGLSQPALPAPARIR